MQNRTRRLKKTSFIFILILILMMLFQTACASSAGKKEPELTKSVLSMDTLAQISVYEKVDEKVVDEAFAYMLQLEENLSRYAPNGDIARINSAAGVAYVKVDEETLELIEKCVDYSEQTEGAFDISLGALIDLWGIATGENHIASQEEIDEALRHTGYKNIFIDKENSAVMLAKKGVILDLGAVGKGYISEKVREFLVEKGVKSAIINFGGNVVLIGTNKGKQPFRIGIQDPFGQRGEYFAVVSGSKTALVSSGSYERYFLGPDGVRYHHIMNPAEGRPAQNGLCQVSIVCDDATLADILSTAVFVMGEEKGLAYLQTMDGVEAVFVSEEKQVTVTEGLKKDFKMIAK